MRLSEDLTILETVVTSQAPNAGDQRMSTNAADAAANRAKDEAAPQNLTSIRPNFIVKDLQAAIAYYRERLGFRLDFQGPADGPFWAGVSRDGIGIMLKAVAPDVLPSPNHTRHEWAPADAHIYSTDPDALFNEFSRRGASFVRKLSFIEEGLWGFTITDADGYLLVFYQLRNMDAR
jgi:catechol 2,3-dioxygenase-like lactoylglutathione lyase family enzyme